MKKLLQILTFGLYRPNIYPFGSLQSKWIRSLERHPERQMKGQLGQKEEDGSYKACCLGEAGLIAGICEWKGDTLQIISNHSTACLSESYSAIGLKDAWGEAGVRRLPNLACMNDNGISWPEIAAHLRKYPHEYFEKFV